MRRGFSAHFARYISQLSNEQLGEAVRWYIVEQHEKDWPEFNYSTKTGINKMLLGITIKHKAISLK